MIGRSDPFVLVRSTGSTGCAPRGGAAGVRATAWSGSPAAGWWPGAAAAWGGFARARPSRLRRALDQAEDAARLGSDDAVGHEAVPRLHAADGRGGQRPEAPVDAGPAETEPAPVEDALHPPDGGARGRRRGRRLARGPSWTWMWRRRRAAALPARPHQSPSGWLLRMRCAQAARTTWQDSLSNRLKHALGRGARSGSVKHPGRVLSRAVRPGRRRPPAGAAGARSRR